MAKKAETAEQEVNLKDLLTAQQKQIEDLTALVKAMSQPKELTEGQQPAKKRKNDGKPKILQHKGPIRQFTVNGAKVLKIYKGTVKVDHPRFEKNVVITPGSVLEVTADLAEFLLDSGDFQKYGLDQ